MDASRLDRVQVDVAGEIVEITWGERDALLGKLRRVAGNETIIEKLEGAGASRPVDLDDEQVSRLRTELGFWDNSANEMPESVARLLTALIGADPGIGRVEPGSWGG